MEEKDLAHQVEHYTLNQRVYNKIRELIETGAIPLGTQLDERTLASELAVSRTPLREAITKLVEEGLVERRPYRGNFVRVLTIKQVNDLYEVRGTLEGLAIRLAVGRLSEEKLARLRLILEDTQKALEGGDLVQYGTADQRFHDTIAQFSENGTLIETLGRLRQQIHLVRSDANRDPQVVARTALERSLILAALEARDAQEAARLMEAHIDGVRRAVIAHLQASARTEEKQA